MGRSQILLEKMQVCHVTDTSSDLETLQVTFDFQPTRAAGLKRLEQFVARTGRHYARTRNYDFGKHRRNNVSGLSPWLRHRLVTEQEVLTRVLATHSPSMSEKFVQEVFWRTYFKGWLEQRPSVWVHYQRDLMRTLEDLDGDASLAARFKDAVCGNTGFPCFDHWARELVETGYLHNHARMWFASIWIFTLRLPWQLGADFFLRHLLDGDPASNTLSWRWVGGLHTRGKTYLARAENIAKYTEGRFQPKGLATHAQPLVEESEHPRIPIAFPQQHVGSPYLLLLTEDDLSGAGIMPVSPVAVVGVLATHGRSPNPIGKVAQDFACGAMKSALGQHTNILEARDNWCDALIEAARQAGVTTIATAHAPIGPVRSRLDRAEPQLKGAGITLARVLRPYDREAWPHTKTGFFGLKKKIPGILSNLSLIR
ncbi:FAD-binding domain-containing protein [Roseibium sp. RKSG952]|uniref:FAD-binding domain-containing protein n=1 Tax=Roseibium sp. RKSG952 TaxID=2529384 RepID=UPI001FCA79D0|nr:FAD-binding domain-containing protein [Roseibium sp. RKSG952]